MNIARVFPRVTKATPNDEYTFYDTPDDYEPLVEAGKKLLAAGFTTASHTLRAYVLIGYPKDTFKKAEKRLMDTIRAGFLPIWPCCTGIKAASGIWIGLDFNGFGLGQQR